MDIHKPKPFHGWREFLKEYGIIVLGVLTALSLEQAVEWVHWQEQVHVAEEAMRNELLFDNGPEIYQRAAMHPCVIAGLDAIRASVESNAPRAEVVRAIDRYWIQVLTYDSIAASAVSASGLADHMRPDRRETYAMIYAAMPPMQKVSEEERQDYARLRAVRRTGGALSAGEGEELLRTVEALRGDEQMMWLEARWVMPRLKKLGEGLDQGRMQNFMSRARAHYGDCIQPLADDWLASAPQEP